MTTLTKSELIAAMDAHDAEGIRLEEEMTALGLDAKSIKAIRKAETAAAKARATLAELMGEPVAAPVTEAVSDETKTDSDGIGDQSQAALDAHVAAQKKGGK